MVAMGTSRPHSGWRPGRRRALPRGGDTPRLRQVWRATKSDTWSDSRYLGALCPVLSQNG